MRISNRSPDVTRKAISLKMRLKNYRLFADSGWFTIAPLTCLVGRNSSGKSSILSSILLLKQSVEQEGTGWGANPPPLVLSGRYCDLGNYSDLVHNHHESSEISFSFSVTFADLERAYTQRGVPLVQLAAPRQRTYYGGGYFFGSTRGQEKLPKKGSIEVEMAFSAEEPFGPSIRRLEVITTNMGTARFSRTPQGKNRRPTWGVHTDVLPPRSLRVETYRGSFFPIIQTHDASFKKCGKPMRRKIQTFVAAVRMFWTFLQQGLMRSEAVGPFRTPPERRYAFGGFGASRGGPSGEQTIDLLITEMLLRPHGQRVRSLHNALSFWIRHLQLANSLDVKDIARRLNLFQIQVTGAGRNFAPRGAAANLADVGFGISQILPVLMQGLLMRPGGVYLVQQPEIHLHPDAQAGLADFFIYLASFGVITIVETHSEYLLLRLRRRLAENTPPISMGISSEGPAPQPLKPSDVSVLFTGFEHKTALVKQLFIGSSFQFENLPAGFMSQALDDRVALLKAVNKRK